LKQSTLNFSYQLHSLINMICMDQIHIAADW
jgi:hypothetical protein